MAGGRGSETGVFTGLRICRVTLTARFSPRLGRPRPSTVRLHAAGIFTWAEWAATLSDEIKRAQAEGDPDLGNTYYTIGWPHWNAWWLPKTF